MKQIGSGSFGDIYLGVNCVSGEPVAVKLEPVTAGSPQLEAEFKLYQLLNKTGTVGSPGVAKVMHFCQGAATQCAGDGAAWDVSLRSCSTFCSAGADAWPIRLSAYVEYLHSQGWVHQDVQARQFQLWAKGQPCRPVYLIDFGLCKRYLDFKGRHIPYIERTAPSCPGRVSKPINKRQKYERISECKMQTSVESLCQGFPCSELAMLINYCRSLHFDELRITLICANCCALPCLGYQFDWAFDWIVLRNQICSQPPQQPVMQQAVNCSLMLGDFVVSSPI
uniref:Protein kinase domain-containing protein n=1 Tax=Macrostomum lignano TaxID=282301 RepID=A0A1I8F9I9_9PLAT